MDELIDVRVETPKGSRVKYEWDHERHGIRLDRRLYSATVFPADYGYIADTSSADGEDLDVLVLTHDPTFPGCWVLARPIGVFWITYPEDPRDGSDGRQTREAKVLAVPHRDPSWDEIREAEDLAGHQRDEISHFFDVYKELEPGRVPSPAGYEGRAAALEVIAGARRAAGATDEAAVDDG